MTLSCTAETGRVISAIEFASYGLPVGQCGGYHEGRDCHSAKSLGVAEECLGKESCTIAANNANFDDLCYGTVKRLYIQYRRYCERTFVHGWVEAWVDAGRAANADLAGEKGQREIDMDNH